jgi:hypothetical protein
VSQQEKRHEKEAVTRIFTRLRELWIADTSANGRTSTSLAAALGTTRQKVNDYASGARPVPDRVIQHMLRLVGPTAEIRLRADGVYVLQGRAAPAAGRLPWQAAGTIPWNAEDPPAVNPELPADPQLNT